jgi:Arm DNA-binding domain
MSRRKRANDLTPAFINRLTPLPLASADKAFRDPLRPGLYLVLQASGVKSWSVRFRNSEGRTRKFTIGRWPDVSISAARDEARRVIEAAKLGRDPQDEKLRQRRGTQASLYHAVAADYIERQARPNNRSWKVTARHLGLRVEPDETLHPAPTGYFTRWLKRAVARVTKADVQDLVDDVRTRSGPVAANRHLAALKVFFNWCVERDVLAASPAAHVRRPAKEEARDRVLENFELRVIWDAAANVPPAYGDLVRALMLLGQRPNEVGGMREAELSGDTWTIPALRTKNKRAHQVPLVGLAARIVASRPRVNGMLFTVFGKKPIAASASKAKAQLDEAITRVHGKPLASWQLRDLRRTVTSGMGRLGVDHLVADRALNHKSGAQSAIAAVYNRNAYFVERRAAFEKWDAHVKGLIG